MGNRKQPVNLPVYRSLIFLRYPLSMVKFFLTAAIFCLLAKNSGAIPTPTPVLSPGEQCRTGIAAAERAQGIPQALLGAIGHVESGRKDPVTGAWGAWPWTINVEGQGAWFATKAEAIAAVDAARARGSRSIDVGCMQVNLMHHPDAFLNLDQAFDPAANTAYAARFLQRLYGQTGDWMKAAAWYHSANPAEGEPYAAKVAAIWPEEQRKSGMAPAPVLPFGQVQGGLFGNVTPPFPAHPPPTVETRGGVAAPQGGITGHGLDFYRAMPVRMNMAARIIPRAPVGVMTR